MLYLTRDITKWEISRTEQKGNKKKKELLQAWKSVFYVIRFTSSSNPVWKGLFWYTVFCSHWSTRSAFIYFFEYLVLFYDWFWNNFSFVSYVRHLYIFATPTLAITIQLLQKYSSTYPGSHLSEVFYLKSDRNNQGTEEIDLAWQKSQLSGVPLNESILYVICVFLSWLFGHI